MRETHERSIKPTYILNKCVHVSSPHHKSTFIFIFCIFTSVFLIKAVGRLMVRTKKAAYDEKIHHMMLE